MQAGSSSPRSRVSSRLSNSRGVYVTPGGIICRERERESGLFTLHIAFACGLKWQSTMICCSSRGLAKNRRVSQDEKQNTTQHLKYLLNAKTCQLPCPAPPCISLSLSLSVFPALLALLLKQYFANEITGESAIKGKRRKDNKASALKDIIKNSDTARGRSGGESGRANDTGKQELQVNIDTKVGP